MTEGPSIAIVGGGCSGTLAAVHLLKRRRPVQVQLIEPRLTPGQGLAYSTRCPDHLLNVPSNRMSYSNSSPNDFAEWLKDEASIDDPFGFATRESYGRYLAERLRGACQDALPSQRLEHFRSGVLDIDYVDGRAVLRLDAGPRLEADFVVLALGHLPPKGLPFFPPDANGPAFYDSAWQAGALASADPTSSILLVGTGLTAVDAFLALRRNGHRGRVHMVSRRGLISRTHGESRQVSPSAPPAGRTLRETLREVRRRIDEAADSGSDWRCVIDGLRDFTNDMWGRLTPAERKRFCRHLKPFWDVHRHRMAPRVGAAVAAAQADGTLRLHAGRIQQINERSGVLAVGMRLRSQGDFELRIQRVINCTGAEQDFRNSDSELLHSLFRTGRLTVNDLNIGVRTTAHGEVIGRNGRPSSWLYALGPMRAGGLFETTAVPEIRKQAAELADVLLGVATPNVRDPFGISRSEAVA